MKYEPLIAELITWDETLEKSFHDKKVALDILLNKKVICEKEDGRTIYRVVDKDEKNTPQNA